MTTPKKTDKSKKTPVSTSKESEMVADTKGIMQRHKEKIYFTTPTTMLAQKGSVQWPVPKRPREKFSQRTEPILEPIPGFSENQKDRKTSKKLVPVLKESTKGIRSQSMLSSMISSRSMASTSLLDSALFSEDV
uniref:Uncharacterized protein n=1 Tax=Strigamia maritima TaxID=126957 RepID=T1JNK5_STRMM